MTRYAWGRRPPLLLSHLTNAVGTLFQVFLADRIVTTADAAAAFDSLTADDVRRVGETMLAGAPSVAASGAIGGIPRFDKVASFFA